jgi:hypothetical protein
MIKYPYDATYWTFQHKYLTGTQRENLKVLLSADYVDADRTLVIPFVTKDHAGTYNCVAKVNETEVENFVNIDVIFKAEITDSPKECRKSQY